MRPILWSVLPFLLFWRTHTATDFVYRGGQGCLYDHFWAGLGKGFCTACKQCILLSQVNSIKNHQIWYKLIIFNHSHKYIHVPLSQPEFTQEWCKIWPNALSADSTWCLKWLWNGQFQAFILTNFHFLQCFYQSLAKYLLTVPKKLFLWFSPCDTLLTGGCPALNKILICLCLAFWLKTHTHNTSKSICHILSGGMKSHCGSNSRKTGCRAANKKVETLRITWGSDIQCHAS